MIQHNGADTVPGKRGSHLSQRALTWLVAGIFATIPTLASAISLKFSWIGYAPCGSSSPAFELSDVPVGTAKLLFHMVDQNVPNFPHGGGAVSFGGNNRVPAGASPFTGPCPPSGEQHSYQWTVQAQDAGGKIIATARAVAKFPP